MKDYRTYLFAMLKGGVGKTSSAVFTALELVKRGEHVLLVDMDRVNQGVVDWISRMVRAGIEIPGGLEVVRPEPDELAALTIKRHTDKHRAAGYPISTVVVDIGGEQPATVREVSLLADVTVLPVGADQAELGRLANTISILEANERGVRDFLVLLTRVPQPRRGAALAVRELVAGSGNRVAEAEIPRNRELYAVPWGTLPADMGAYADFTTELELLADIRDDLRELGV